MHLATWEVDLATWEVHLATWEVALVDMVDMGDTWDISSLLIHTFHIHHLLAEDASKFFNIFSCDIKYIDKYIYIRI